LEKSISVNLFDCNTRAVSNLVAGLNGSATSSARNLDAAKIHLQQSAWRETEVNVKELHGGLGKMRR
jgi:hypothetical protein